MVAELRRLKSAVTSPGEFVDPTAPQQLAALLRATTRCVGTLQERKHEVLIKELLDLPFWKTPAAARVAVLDFIVHAVVANGALVQTCLHTLVYGLMPAPGPPIPDPIPGEKWIPQPHDAAVQDDVIAALQKVLELVPTSAQRLSPMLQGNFPHRLRDRNTQCLYLRGVLAVAESPQGAGVREQVLYSAIEHLITIDVEIRWEDIVDVWTEEAEEEVGGSVPGEEEPDIFELEGMSELELVTGQRAHRDNKDNGQNGAMPGGGWEGRGHGATGNGQINGGAPPGSEGAATVVPPPIAVDQTADKLDSLMEMT